MSAYRDAVEEDSPAYYWPMGDAAGDLAAAAGAVALKTGGGVTHALTGPLEAGDEGALGFDGSSGWAQSASELDLTASGLITVEFWLNWAANGTDDDFAYEFGPNANSTPGFNLDFNAGDGASIKTFYTGGGDRRWTFARPAAAAFHHLAIAMAPETRPVVYVDGAPVEVEDHEVSNLQSGTFGVEKLSLMSRDAAALFGQGRMAHFAIYAATLSEVRVQAHYAARAGEEPPEEGMPETTLPTSVAIGEALASATVDVADAAAAIVAPGAEVEVQAVEAGVEIDDQVAEVG